MSVHHTAKRFRASAAPLLESCPDRSIDLSLSDLLDMHGNGSAHVVLLVMALASILPIAGTGNVMALGMLLLATSYVQGHGQFSLPQRVGRFKLDPKWSRRSLRALDWIYDKAGRCMQPRWTWAMHPSTRLMWSAWIGLMAVIIFLPLPLGNVLPAFSLMALSLGWMFADGLALAVSLLFGLSALAYTLALWQAVWLTWTWFWG